MLYEVITILLFGQVFFVEDPLKLRKLGIPSYEYFAFEDEADRRRKWFHYRDWLLKKWDDSKSWRPAGFRDYDVITSYSIHYTKLYEPVRR